MKNATAVAVRAATYAMELQANGWDEDTAKKYARERFGRGAFTL